MAESVRELVVTLSLEAGNFNRAASDIQKQIKGVEAEFKAMGTGASKWGQTLEGQKAKMASLNEKLKLQEKNVKNLEAAWRKAKSTLDASRGTKGELIAARNLSDIETKLNNAKDAAMATRREIELIAAAKMTALGTSIMGLGSTLKRFGTMFSIYVGGPLAALGISSFNAFKDYEMAAAMLEGKLDGPKEDVDMLSDAALRMSETIPVAYADIMAIMTGFAAAGVPTENIEQMTLVMAQLSAVTGMSADEVSTNMVKFMNSMGLPLDNVDQLASALILLADTSIATESDIFSMATRMAGTAGLAGFDATEVLALAAAFSSMGIEAEAGGTSAAKLMKALQLAAETGKDLKGLAAVSGLTGEEFKDMFKSDPTGLMMAFFDGLASGGAEGNKSVTALLESLGITETRLANLISVGAANPDMFKDLLGIGAEGFEENLALGEKAALVFDTVSGSMDVMTNTIRNAQADLGENVADVFGPIIGKVGELVGKFSELDEDTQTKWVKVSAAIVALGPVAIGVGKVASGVGSIITHIGKINAGNAGSTVSVFGAIGKLFSTPVGQALLIAGAVATIGLALKNIPSELDILLAEAKDIPINFDPALIAEMNRVITDTQEKLGYLRGEKTKEGEGRTQAVLLGYGTNEMAYEALGYEAAKLSGVKDDIISGYYATIAEIEAAINENPEDLGNEARKAQIEQLKKDMAAEVASAETVFAETVSKLYDVLAKQMGVDTGKLQLAESLYNLYDDVYKTLDSDLEGEALAAKFAEINEAAVALGFEDRGWTTAYSQALSVMLPEITSAMNEAVTAVGQEGIGASILQAMLNNPMIASGLDVTKVTGALEGALAAFDWKAAANKATAADAGGNTFGSYLTQGMADGVAANVSTVEGSMYAQRDAMINALRTAWEMESPSQVMAREGVNLALGIQAGILQGIPAVVAGMNVLGAAVTAAAKEQGKLAGIAYGEAFSKNVHAKFSIIIAQIQRELINLNARILAGYGKNR